MASKEIHEGGKLPERTPLLVGLESLIDALRGGSFMQDVFVLACTY